MKDYSGSSLEEELRVKDAQINKVQLSKLSATMEARSYWQCSVINIKWVPEKLKAKLLWAGRRPQEKG